MAGRQDMFRSFPQTRWSLVARAGGASPETKRQAMAELLERYRPAFLRYLVAVRGYDVDQAEDLVQGFLAKVLERDLVAAAEQARGKFRSFMLKSLSNYAIDQFRSAPPACADVDEHLDAAEAPEAADAFHLAWVRTLLQQAYEAMRAECESSGGTHIWRIFESRVLEPARTGAEPTPYAELVQRYGFQSPKQAANYFQTGQRMFERTLRGLIADYAGQDEVDAELGDLISTLAAPR